MRLYETTFLINPQTDDVALDRQVKDVIDIITTNGGKLIHEDRMGTRRLAYPIQGLNQAYYTSLLFESEVGALPPLDRHYRLGEAYLRSLTILFEGDVERVTNPEPDTRPGAYVPRHPAPPVSKPAAAPSDGPVGRREPAAAPAPAAPAEAAPETPAETVAEKPVEAAPEAPAETVAEKPAEATPEAPAEKPAEAAPEAPAEKAVAPEAAAVEPEKKAAEPTADAPAEKNDEEDEL
jgi:ribosomal protein S6